METNHHNPLTPPEANTNSFLHSTTAKVIMVGMLTLILLLPLHYVQGIIKERSFLQKDVVSEITRKWGEKVYICGPILKVPYTTVSTNEIVDAATKKVTIQRRAYIDFLYIFPEELVAKTNVKVFKKHRNNYDTAVFNASLKLTGHYKAPNLQDLNIAPETIDWTKATLLIDTNSTESINGAISANVKGDAYSIEASAMATGQDSIALQSTPINLGTGISDKLPFEISLSYKGSQSLAIVPIGGVTKASVSGDWPSPKFNGNYLPETSHVTDNGFTASWQISKLNRPFAQQYTSKIPDISRYSFDVDFDIPVDEFQQNERASKYGFLVIGLTFLVFFLIQNISRITIHIFQYTMIGLALIMFYTLLISITEHSSFRLAYLIAGISVVTMIGLYSISILKNRKFPMFIAAALTALYTFIYIIIQLENYALLAGSIGLFLILGAVMYFSRKIQWNPSVT